MKITISGLRDGEPWPGRGEIADVPEAEAIQLIAAGQAEPAPQPEPAPEPAPAPPAAKSAPAAKPRRAPAKK